MAVSDDDIIKRKLLIEGDGGSDDRRLSSLLKSFLKWSQSSDQEDDSHATMQRMLSTLAQCEFSMAKSLHVHNMNLKEQSHYHDLQQQIEDKLQGAQEKITACKNDLLKAKRIRRNRQEYDALAKVIQQHPDRQQTLSKLEALDKDLESVKDTKESLESKLELRRKQFHVLITAIHEMQRILQEDEQHELDLEDTDMDMS